MATSSPHNTTTDGTANPPVLLTTGGAKPAAAVARAADGVDAADVADVADVADGADAAKNSSVRYSHRRGFAGKTNPDAEIFLDLPLILDALLADGYLSQRQVEDVLLAPRSKRELNLHPLEIVAVRELENRRNCNHNLDLETLTLWLCERSGQDYQRIDPLQINVNAVTEVMSYGFAQRHNILALAVADDHVVIASSQPCMYQWEGMLTQTLRGRRIRRVVCNPAELSRYQLEFYSIARSARKAEAAGMAVSGITNLEQLLELGGMKSAEANDAHVVNIVDWLLQYAFEQRASDIHIEPRREQGHIRFRIDGILHHVYQLPGVVNQAVTSRLKILARMDVAEKRRPQDGRIKTLSQDGEEIELRLSTLPTAFGEKMVLRIFDPQVLLRSFQELGLCGDDLQRWHGMTHSANGIVLVTGPTGSGKTTTLYSTLKQLATAEVNVCTVEDPIEMMEPAFNQMQVQHNIELSFAAGVRALLRQDPDIIMIGEVRDLETAEMAIQAALTGHLVICTLHTNDAPTAITRLLDLGVPAYMIRATLLGVMAQRLVRTLCPHCKVEEEVDQEAWQLLTTPHKVKPPARLYAARGCLECRDTGYLGRRGIYEILPLAGKVQRWVKADTDLDEIRKAGMADGMRTLRLAGAQQVGAGFTTIAEVLRVLPS